MASTFSGPVRSENGFASLVGGKDNPTNTITLSTYSTSITIAASGTAHKESSIGIPANFIPMGVAITVTSAAANNVNLVDIGTDTDTDGYVDGISVAINSTGFKGFFPCNGVLGMSGGTTTAADTTADEVELVISGTAGAGGVIACLLYTSPSPRD